MKMMSLRVQGAINGSSPKRLFYSLLAIFFSTILLAADQQIYSTSGLGQGSYREGSDGKLHPLTKADVDALWSGVWKEDTNGLRDQITFLKGSPSYLLLQVGSVKFNSPDYVGEPKGKFAKFELKNPQGAVVPYLDGKTLEAQPPSKIRSEDLPRYNGGIVCKMGFLTNGGPDMVNHINFDDWYRIIKEGDYTLTVCPVIYKWEANREFLDRIDLPCITTTLHLMPSNSKK